MNKFSINMITLLLFISLAFGYTLSADATVNVASLTSIRSPSVFARRVIRTVTIKPQTTTWAVMKNTPRLGWWMKIAGN